MATLFTKIIERKLPAHIVAEDAFHIAFLDKNPIAHGHTLVVPKKEVDYIFDLDDVALANLMNFTKKIAIALQKITTKRIGVSVLGLDIPHIHIHLVPIQKQNDLNLNGPKISFSHERFVDLALQLQKTINL